MQRKELPCFQQESIQVPVSGNYRKYGVFYTRRITRKQILHLLDKMEPKNLAEDIKTEFLGEIPLVQSIRESGDVGHPVALQNGTVLEKSFSEITKKMVSELVQRNANLPPTEVVRITTMSGCSAVKKIRNMEALETLQNVEKGL